MASLEASIVIVNYNCKETVDCIKSIKSNNYPKSSFEVIVVDNNSSDNSLNKVKEKFPDVKTIVLDKNCGFGIGCNYGAKYARGKYLIFLNPDSVVDKNWLRNLLYAIKTDKKIGTATSKILYFDSKDKINSLGCFLSIFGVCGSINSLDYIKDSNGNKLNVFAPSGTSFIISKNLFKKINGFDENLFLYAEDVDLGWKVLNEGFENILTPDSIVYHKTVLSSKQKSAYFYFYNTRNNLLIIIKNATFPYLIPMLMFSTFFHLSRSITFAILGRGAHAYATFKGILWIFLNFRSVMRIRNSWKNRKDVYIKFVSKIKDSIPIIFNKASKHLN